MTTECTVSPINPCRCPINTGETYVLRFAPGDKLNVIFQNTSPTQTSQILPTIGSQAQQPFNLQAGGLLSKQYETGQFSTATFENQSATKNTVVDITVTIAP